MKMVLALLLQASIGLFLYAQAAEWPTDLTITMLESQLFPDDPSFRRDGLEWQARNIPILAIPASAAPHEIGISSVNDWERDLIARTFFWGLVVPAALLAGSIAFKLQVFPDRHRVNPLFYANALLLGAGVSAGLAILIIHPSGGLDPIDFFRDRLSVVVIGLLGAAVSTLWQGVRPSYSSIAYYAPSVLWIAGGALQLGVVIYHAFE